MFVKSLGPTLFFSREQFTCSELFNVKYSKMLSFSLVAEALMGLIYHRPSGENFSFAVVEAINL